MSHTDEGLRAQVVERLVDAAEEIFMLFGRAFAEYKDELLRSKLLQRPHVVLYREDIQRVTVGADSGPEPIKAEEDSTLKISLSSAKVEGSFVNKVTVRKDPAEANRQDSKGEEPGCSVENNTQQNSSDTDTGKRLDKRSAIFDEQKQNAGHSKNSVAKTVISKKRPKRNAVKNRLKYSCSCIDCGVKFSHPQNLMRHIRSTHNKERPHTCSVCQKGFFRRYDYGLHMRKHTGEVQDRKRQNHPSTSERKLSDIQTVTVGTNSGPEPVKFKQEENSTLKTLLYVKTEDFNKAIPQKDPVKEKRKDSGGEEPGCSASLHDKQRNGCSDPDNSTKCNGQELKAGHSKTSAAKSVISEDRPNRYPRKNRPQITHKCSDCGMKFTQHYTLMRHIRNTHNKERPHRCSVCQKGFFRKYDYSTHMRKHAGELPNVNTITLRKDPAKDRQDSEGEKPGCSVENNKQNSSDTDLGKCVDKGSAIFDEQTQKAGHSKNSAAKHIMSKERPQRNAAKNRVKHSYSCIDCEVKFSQRQSLMRHIRCTHNKEMPHRCSVCQKVFFRKYALVNHMRKHTGELPFRCSVCNKGYRYKTSLRDHKCSQSQDEGQMLWSQPLWGGSVASTSETKLFEIQTVTVGVDDDPEPIDINENPPLESLPSVNRQSGEDINESAFPQEDRAEDRRGPFEEEPGCSVDLYLDNNEQHDGSSDTDNSSDWESMDKVSIKNDGQELKDENSATDVTGNNQQHQCAQCFRSFKSKSILNKHLQHHTEQGPFTCQTCNKVFSQKYNYNKHLKHHAGQGSFTCQTCNKVYRHKSTYTQHLRIHSAQNPFTCSICKRAFGKRSRLNEHMRIHTGEKPFSCPGCGMRFRHQTTRDNHLYNVHNVKKPFTCSICLQGFVKKSFYENHMRIHTGERPFRCSVCDKRFRTSQMLSNHMRSHNVDAEMRAEELQ